VLNVVTVEKFGMALAGIGALWFYVLMFLGIKQKSFSDIDEKRRSNVRINAASDSSDLISELKALKSAATIDYSKIEELIRKSQPLSSKPIGVPRSFEDYFATISNGLASRAELADEKSSVLLDKGIFHVRFGMVFYLGCIICWQVLVHYHGYKVEYIYGIGSSSLLFLFIEFLSAWFLKQYRHFVDTATYLSKVKAIFDRYYLVFAALRGNEKFVSNDAKLKTLCDALTDDIKWPADVHLTRADAHFAREAMESMAELVKALKPSNQKQTNNSSESEKGTHRAQGSEEVTRGVALVVNFSGSPFTTGLSPLSLRLAFLSKPLPNQFCVP